jgi:hypothetical protein
MGVGGTSGCDKKYRNVTILFESIYQRLMSMVRLDRSKIGVIVRAHFRLSKFDAQRREEDQAMHDNKELCDKIRSIYPEIGECGININVNYDQEKKAWVVDLKKGERHLVTYLEPQDADACMDGKQCVYLGVQVSQLISSK